jgi:hypothetical protein
MSWQRWTLAIVVLLFAAIQYSLLIYALIDIRRRPRVRGQNKMGWALVAAVVPIAGPLIYGVFGPTSFLPRPNRSPRRENVMLDRQDLQDAP